MGKRYINDEGDEEIMYKQTRNAHQKSKHKHIYQEALLRKKRKAKPGEEASYYLTVGKYCTICGRAVNGNTFFLIDREDGTCSWITPEDYPDLPVVDVEGREPVYYVVSDADSCY